MYLKFRAFRAVNDLDTCMKFVEEHRNVLKDYGITNITTNTDVWMYNPNVYCIVAESVPEGQVLGGVRIQVSDGSIPLPVELAVGKMDAGIIRIVKNFRNNGGVAELCALWNAKKVAGEGISLLLIRAGIAIVGQLKIGVLISICADYTLKMFQKVGFVVDNTLGVDGSFPYPNSTYTARVLGILNAQVFENANAEDRERMKSLRDQPVQKATEQGTSREIIVDYNLVILNN